MVFRVILDETIRKRGFIKTSYKKKFQGNKDSTLCHNLVSASLLVMFASIDEVPTSCKSKVNTEVQNYWWQTLLSLISILQSLIFTWLRSITIICNFSKLLPEKIHGVQLKYSRQQDKKLLVCSSKLVCHWCPGFTLILFYVSGKISTRNTWVCRYKLGK